MFNVALRCWDKLDSQKTADVLTFLLLLLLSYFFLLCSLFSPNIIPSTEITSVEKPAMLMVAITNIKCNTLLYATRFIQPRTQCNARHNICINLFSFILLSSNLSPGSLRPDNEYWSIDWGSRELRIFQCLVNWNQTPREIAWAAEKHLRTSK